MSCEQAGAYMGITREAIRMMVRRGRLPHIKQGKRTYIDRADIDRMMESAKVMPVA
jgi:excisionase family DNA binding protein